ncbi:mechanosensitive ion channel protein MscS [Roseovarius spongiae]|uniref:Mechanosensitive ion channel protein MscS n=1 Tax=Roseovarius spongiae TaxID=2320272 RepID=A0A3A8AYB5_9RHOB|nr:mechanosensitive ion channel domain-containing protein [Roseovarius spongiae]RKF15231.1 mechanosensitive ion channel protein MscS [Roseovarius spongiae]
MIRSLTDFARACALLVLCLAAGFAAAQERWFEIDTLNAGLGPAPQAIDRSTPQGALESFMHHASRGDFSRAAHLLDLGDIAPEQQPAAGARLVKQLYTVIDRKVVIPWGDLSDRPDGWILGTSDNPAAGRTRRSIALEWLDMGRREVALRVNRLKPSDGDPVWVIARQSVANIPALYERFGPTRIERMLPDWARDRAFWGLYVWEVLFLPLLALASVLLGKLTYRFVGSFQRQRDTRLTRAIVRALRWPATIAVTAAFVGFCTSRVLVVSGLLDSFISPAVVIGVVTAGAMAAVLIIDEVLDHLLPNTPGDLADPGNSHLRDMATTIAAVRKFVIVIAVMIGVGLVLSSANLFSTLGLSLLASAGALTIIMGFAAREVLSNIMASVQIAINRSARIGDQLIFEGHFCTVERIHFTYVQLAIWNGNRLIVPVSYFVSDAFENWSIEDVEMLRLIELRLAHTANVAALRDVFFDAIREEDGDDTGPVEEATVMVTGQDAVAMTVLFALPTPNPSTAWSMECAMRERLIQAAARMEAADGVPMLPHPPLHETQEA